MMSGEQGGSPAGQAGTGLQAAPASLSFQEFNRRIEALPEGPIAVLNSPAWQRWLDRLGLVPLLLFGGLCCAFTFGWLAPAAWMVPVAQTLLVTMTALWLPGWIRSIWVLWRDMRKGTGGFMQQWDHDLALQEGAQQWLAQYPREHLEQRLLQCRQLQGRLQSKLGVFLGGVERWGMLPALVAVFYLLQEREKLLELPGWLLLIGVCIVVFWFMAVSALRARLRLGLMEDLLHGVLQKTAP